MKFSSLAVTTLGAVFLTTACSTTPKTASQQDLVSGSSGSSGSGMMASGNSELFPPNAQPGQCWSRVLTPAKFVTNSERVLVKPESESISILPAKYEPATERVLVKEESTKLVAVPATYKTVTERVMVRPASTRLKTIPAQYETETNRVLEKAAHTTWKRGDGFRSSSLQTRIDNGTGEVMCLVEVPATYKTV